MIKAHKMYHTDYRQYKQMSGVLMISAWSFAMVIASFLFLWVGFKIDEYLGTAPNFMFGMFFLAIFLCVMRIYNEAKIRMKDL